MDLEESTDMLATRRSRRSTAGNRMEAVMAEMSLDDALKDMDDDVEFENLNDEQDVFGSDFESTDEEMEKQAGEAGEAEVAHEERRVKKAARTRLEKVTAAAHAKHKSTFNSDIQIATPAPKPKAKSARVKLGAVVDAETGEVVGSISQGPNSKKRKSKRKHTVLNTSATVTRLKESEQKRAAQPKKAKVETKRYTQDELIALALDTEEGNIVEHRDYLKNEAEKRKRAQVVRTAVEGPKLRWISRREEIKVPITPPPPPPPPPPIISQPPISAAYRSVYGPPGTLFTPTTYTYTSGTVTKSTVSSTSSTPIPQVPTAAASQLTFSQYLPYQTSTFPTWPPPVQQQSYYPTPASNSTPAPSTFIIQTALSQQHVETATPAAPSTSVPQIPPTVPSTIPYATTLTAAPPEQEYRTETVTKNYVIHELAQKKGGPKPNWAENMQAMFGDHVKWDEIKVLVGKGRPLSRPRQTCLITGRQAHYLDPRTGVPYADSYAYKVLTQLLRHEYVWNPTLGSYMDRGEAPADELERNAQAVEVDGVVDDAADTMNVD